MQKLDGLSDFPEPCRTPRRSRFDALPPQLAPVGLRREAAAAYWSVSPSAFDKLVAAGVAPKPISGLCIEVRLWDRRQLDERFAELSGFHIALATEANDWDGELRGKEAPNR